MKVGDLVRFKQAEGRLYLVSWVSGRHCQLVGVKGMFSTKGSSGLEVISEKV